MGRSLGPWLLVAMLAAGPAAAQSQGLVVRDDTLGEGRGDVVGPGVDPLGHDATYLITPELGEQHGSNLFHSFASFGIGENETATFTGPDGIDNVISRVTGDSESQIDGTLRSTIPGADVWLLNPNGVVFGDGAQLDVPGSFHVSTGDYVGFGEGDLVRFYADPSQPSVLSTATPVAFGFLGEGGAASLAFDGPKFEVTRGELTLRGPDVSLTGADVTAPGGHFSLEAQGEVALTGSVLDVGGNSPGTVSIRGGRLVMTEGSKVLAENASQAAETATPEPGSISVAASESVLVDDSLLSVDTSGAGNAGTIHVTSPEVTFQNGTGFFHDFVDPTNERNQSRRVEVGASAVTHGSGADSGAGGRIEIEAERSLTLQKGVSVSAGSFGIYPDVATGDAGSIHIEAGSLQVLDRSNLTAGAFRSEGNAGSVEIDVRDTLRLDGTPQEGTPREEGAVDYAFIDSSKYFNVGPPERLTQGALGTIDIEAGVVEVLNQGHISSDCGACTAKRNPGDPPNISIKADRVVVAGTRGVVVGSNAGTEGDAGGIEIAAAWLELRKDGSIEALTNGAGNAGDITIDADSLMIGAGGVVDAGTRGKGAGGDIIVHADTVQIGPGQPAFINVSSVGPPPGGEDFVPGDAGAIEIVATDSILLTNEGGQNRSLRESLESGLFTGIFSAAVLGGDGGSITLRAPEITVTDGATVATTTLGGGTAGTILLGGDHILVANGGSVDSTSLPWRFSTDDPLRSGLDAGNVTLDASETIQIVGNDPTFGVSRVSSLSLGSGAAGAVTLHAARIAIDAGAVATTALPSEDGQEGTGGGAILLDAEEELLITNQGRVDASTFIAGAGGNVNLTAGKSITVESTGSGIASRTGAAGDGGGVTLRAPVIELNVDGEVSAKSTSTPGLGELARIFSEFEGLVGDVPEGDRGRGNAGSITLAADKLRLTGGTISTSAEDSGGGNISIEAKRLVHLDNGEITASVTGGAGGDITIDPDVVVLQNGSSIVAQADAGSGGHIFIATDNYFAFPFPPSVVSATAGDPELSGTVEVSTPDVDLAGRLTALPASYLDAASLMRERCAARRSGERAGSFAVRGNGGIPAEPDGWLPGAVSFDVAPGYSATSDLPAGSGGVPLFALGSCR